MALVTRRDARRVTYLARARVKSAPRGNFMRRESFSASRETLSGTDTAVAPYAERRRLGRLARRADFARRNSPGASTE